MPAIYLKILTVDGPVLLPVRINQSYHVAFDSWAKSKRTKNNKMTHAKGIMQALALKRRVGLSFACDGLH
eukprot:10991211-Karenia_brevis.AAC.1